MKRGQAAVSASAASGSALARKLVVVAIAAPALIYAVLAVGVSTSAAFVAPTTALRWNPANSDALGSASFAAIEADTSEKSLSKAEALAMRAYQRSPLSPAAVRTLGYIADARGQSGKALELMNFSLRLSRRDLLTHLWFINHYVAKEDLSRALNHYDMALRTSELGHPVLMPILIKATEDRSLIRPLAIILARRPVWKDDFIRDVISKSPSAVNVALLSQYLAVSGNPFSGVRMDNLTDRLVAEGQFTLAAQLAKRDYANRAIANGGFASAIGTSPFDWKLADDYDLGAAVVERRLQLDAAAGRGGTVATQLLILSPGRYRLTADSSLVESKSAGIAFWTLTCAAGQKQVIATADVSNTSPRQQGSLNEFVVPAARCGAQTLTLSIRSASDTQGYSGWIDNVAIASVAASGSL